MPKARNTSGHSFREVVRILEKDACVLCSMVKRFQSTCIQNANAVHIQALCGFHAWAIAGVADTRSAARIFLQLLESTPLQEEDASALRCSVCVQIAEEEARRSQEFVQLLNDPEFLGWLRERGAMCIPHTRRLLKRVPEPNRPIVLKLFRDGAARLRNGLGSLAVEPEDWHLAALLSRAAEYLGGRRGLALKD